MSYLTAKQAWSRMTGKAIPDTSAEPIEVLMFDGQSLCLGPIGTSVEKSAINKLDRHWVRMLGGLIAGATPPLPVWINGPMAAGYDEAIPSTGLVPAAAAGNIAMCLYVSVALRLRRAAAGLSNPLILTGSNGLGGQEILTFDDDPATGASPFADLPHRMRRFWLSEIWRATAGRTRNLRYDLFAQGEADSNAAKGVYRTSMDEVWRDRQAQTQEITGQTAIPCTTQVGGYCDSASNKTYWPVIEQVQCVEALGGVILPPWYPHILHDASVHPGDYGCREMADLISYHLVEREGGRPIPPFKPTTQVIGSQIVLTYPLRPGERLEWGDPAKYAGFGGFCANQGFETVGAGITAVSLGADRASVVIDCSGPPTGWRYAFQFQDVTAGAVNGQNYSAHRGLLRKAGLISPILAAQAGYQWSLSWREDW